MNKLTLDTTVLAKGMIPPGRKKKDPIMKRSTADTFGLIVNFYVIYLQYIGF